MGRCPKSQVALESRTVTGGGPAVPDCDLSGPSNGEREQPIEQATSPGRAKDQNAADKC